MSASECLCIPAPAPFDNCLQSNPKCLAHRMDIQCVAAGWDRNGALWTHPEMRGLFTIEQAYDKLIELKEKRNGHT